MKKLMILVAAMALYATSAFAVGCDFNWNACPGGAGSATDATIDCAGAGAVTGYMTFQPSEALTDLVAVDTIVDIMVPGSAFTSANFWDFENVNAAALAVSRVRPATICAAYSYIWNIAGSTEGYGALVFPTNPSHVRIAAGANRPSNFSSAANAKIFGYALTIDGSTSTEGGGTADGCALPVVMALNQALVGSAGGTPTTLLTAPSTNASPCNHINGDASLCGAVPTQRHTWGRLKSLYR